MMRRKLKAAAVAKLQERSHALEALRQTEDALKEAQREQEEALKGYKDARREASQEVEAFRDANTRYRAIGAKEKEEERFVDKEAASLGKMREILAMEERRIDAFLVAGQGRLEGKLRHVAAARDEAERSLAATKKRYSAWQAEARDWAEEAERRAATYKTSQQRYDTDRNRLLGAAEAKAARGLEGSSSLASEDWAWSGEEEGLRPGNGDAAEEAAAALLAQ